MLYIHRENEKFCETVLACSYRAYAEFFFDENSVENLYTVHFRNNTVFTCVHVYNNPFLERK